MSHVIGAAAKDPSFQAAQGPRLQAAAWSAGRAGVDSTKKGLVEVRAYVQESHCSVQILCFCAAVALLVSSLLAVINVFHAFTNPFQYLFAFWNAVFAIVIIIMDGKPDWMGSAQTKLFSLAAFLATKSGRACFYLYVGSINLLLLPDSWFWKVVYLAIGGTLCAISAIMLLSSSGCCSNRHQETELREEAPGA
ncbi:unnamed protein product [Polarella glacialis]|uniref:Uncharacterized protein n=1 Tax=Polarella glacialis TaxID=89957 RepID=A0A813LT58_POLGL|nr:unnamed protein product [Polarella glacialis]